MAGEEEKAAQLDGGAASECGEVGKIDRLLSHPHSLSVAVAPADPGPDRTGEENNTDDRDRVQTPE